MFRECAIFHAQYLPWKDGIELEVEHQNTQLRTQFGHMQPKGLKWTWREMKRGYRIEQTKASPRTYIANHPCPSAILGFSQFGKDLPMTSTASYGFLRIVRSSKQGRTEPNGIFSSHPSPQHRRISLQGRNSRILSVGWPSHHRWGGWVTLPFQNVQSDLDHLSSEHVLAHHLWFLVSTWEQATGTSCLTGNFQILPLPMHWTFSYKPLPSPQCQLASTGTGISLQTG